LVSRWGEASLGRENLKTRKKQIAMLVEKAQDVPQEKGGGRKGKKRFMGKNHNSVLKGLKRDTTVEPGKCKNSRTKRGLDRLFGGKKKAQGSMNGNWGVNANRDNAPVWGKNKKKLLRPAKRKGGWGARNTRFG